MFLGSEGLPHCLVLLNPVNWLQTYLLQLFFRRSWRRLVIVIKPHSGGQAHQDAFNASVGFEAKDSTSVMYQVKFCVPATPYFLPVFMSGGIRRVLSFLYNGHIGRDKSVAAGFAEVHPEVYILLIIGALIVIEYTANAPAFIVPVLVHKVIITLLFECWEKGFVELVTDIFIGTVKVNRIFFY